MKKFDVIIVGTGAAGCFSALHLDDKLNILMVTKEKAEESGSYLAQGGICVLKDEEDFNSFFEDTLKAGHYKNKKEAVEVMINSSNEVIKELIDYNVDFNRENGQLLYTREGAHSKSRILYHKDITGQEITSKLLSKVKKRKNITLLENTKVIDIIEKDKKCIGVILNDKQGNLEIISSKCVILATGGIGGIFKNSTNFPHITGDSLGIAIKHLIKLKDLSYIQIHPTTLYSKKSGRRFLISESVRGEGALLYNKNFQRFTDELQSRDVVTKAILAEVQKDKSEFVWLDMRPIIERGIDITKRFPNIIKKCKEEGYNPMKECIPVVPAQHYFMGGIEVDLNSSTSLENLYAVGETSCNGVHGANRLASNSLLEILVFSKRAAININKKIDKIPLIDSKYIKLDSYSNNKLFEEYKTNILEEIEKDKIMKEKIS